MSEANDQTGPIRVGAGRPSRLVIGLTVVLVIAGVCAVIPPVAVLGFLLSALAIVPAVVAFVRARRHHFANTGLARTVLIAAPSVLLVSFVVVGLTATPTPRPIEDASSLAATSASAAAASPAVAPPALPPVAAVAAPVAPPAPAPVVAPAPLVAAAPAPVVAAAPAVNSPAEAPAASSSCDEATHYVNSSHVCVPRPVAAPSAPAGATAQCNDGTYSFSQHRQGTCSGHHGVETWL